MWEAPAFVTGAVLGLLVSVAAAFIPYGEKKAVTAVTNDEFPGRTQWSRRFDREGGDAHLRESPGVLADVAACHCAACGTA